MSKKYLVVCLLLAIFTGGARSASIVPAAPVGTLPGTLTVSPTGSAEYEIPIDVPAGRNGVEPRLAVAYDHRGANGLLGVGWSMRGLSRITRCRRSLAYGQRTAGVGFHALDQLCLDGAPLVAVGGRPYGADGTEYRTVPDRHARIVSYGDLTAPTGHFAVYYKDGWIGRFRVRLEAPRISSTTLDGTLSAKSLAVFGWALSSLEDRSGNVLTVDWTRTVDPMDAYGFEHYPRSIRYSFPTRLSKPRREVRFEYEPRSDVIDSYVAGFHHRITKRLIAIDTYAPADGWDRTLVHRYEFAYRNDSSTGRSLLASARKCDAARVCLPATTFQWEIGGLAFDAPRMVASVTGTPRLRIGDVNGDGRDDIVYADESGPAWKVLLSNRDGFDSAIELHPHEQVVALIDHDLDGAVDIIRRGFGYQLYRWTGRAFDKVQDLGTFATDPKIGDLDGNGTPDAMYRALRGPDQDVRGPWVWRKNSSGLFVAEAPTGVADPPGVPRSNGIMLRLLGNGATQMMYDAGSRYGFLFNSGAPGDDGIQRGQVNLRPGWGTHIFLDVNGDGLDDMLDTQGGLQINTGWGFGPRYDAQGGRARWAPPDQLVPPEFWSYQLDNGIRVVDLNNDGRMDIVRSWGGGGEACLSDGRTLWCHRLDAIQLDRPTRLLLYPYGFLDIDGDGVQDLIQARRGVLRVWRRSGATGDRIVGVRNGVGSTNRISYSTTSDPAVYVAGSRCGYPQRCNVRRLPVVRGVQRDNGSGWNDELYAYSDARFDVRGEGFLGFGRTRQIDVARERTREWTYGMARTADGRYPHLGMPTRVTVFQRLGADRVRLHTTAITNRALGGPGGTSFAVPTAAAEAEYEWENPGGIPTPPLDEPLHAAALARQPFRSVTVSRRFDAYGNVESETRTVADGTVVDRTLDYDRRPNDWLVALVSREHTRSTAPNGSSDSFEIVHEHDAKGRLTKTTVEPARVALTRTTQYSLGQDGLVERITVGSPTDAERKTGFAYDRERVYLVAVTNPAGHVSTVETHAALGVPTRTIDANGAEAQFTYDTFGRLRRRQDADGRVVTITHLADAGAGAYRVRYEVNTGARTIVDMDRLHRPIERRAWLDGKWALVQQSFDAAGHPVRRTLARFEGESSYAIRRTYDAMGRLVKTDHPDGTSERIRYDALKTHFWDAADNYGYMTLNADGRIETSVNRLGSRDVTTAYAYGPFGRLEQVGDAAGHVVYTLMYDSLGRRIRATDADAGSYVATYNAFGELLTERNALGQLTEYERDVLGRVVRMKNADGVSRYLWDVAVSPTAAPLRGKLQSAQSADGTLMEYTYDAIGRITSTTLRSDTGPIVITRDYDSVGRLSTIGYPQHNTGESSVRYFYAADGTLASLRTASTTFWEAGARDARGREVLERLGNGARITRQFEPATGRVRDIESFHPVSGGTRPFQKVTYTYSPHGYVESRTDHIEGRREHFRYDSLNRLVTWRLNETDRSESFSYEYDDLGNLTRSIEYDGTHTYEHGENAGPHAVTSIDGQPVAYDALGRRTSGPDGEVSYTPFNLPRLVKAEKDAATHFEYDAFSRRTLKRTGDATTWYLDGLYERRLRGSGPRSTSHHYFVRTDTRVVAEIVERDDERIVRYLHPDRLGSVNVITDDRAAVLERRWYTPFGQLTSSEPTGLAAHTGGFTGHETDWAQRLVNMKGRMYDTRSRRFLTPDPIIGRPYFGQDFNRYAYALNSPVTLTDPTGLDESITDFDDDGPAGNCVGTCDFDGVAIHSERPEAVDSGGGYDDGGDSTGYGYDDGYVDQSYDDSGYDYGVGACDCDAVMSTIPNWYYETLPPEPTLAEEWAHMSHVDLHSLPIQYLPEQLAQFAERNAHTQRTPAGHHVDLDERDIDGSFGVTLELDAIVVIGLVAGLNLQWTPYDGYELYFYGGGGVGYSLGLSFGVNLAAGGGPWEGQSAGFSASPGLVGGNIFGPLPPTLEDGWVGGGPSVSLGPPGAAITATYAAQ